MAWRMLLWCHQSDFPAGIYHGEIENLGSAHLEDAGTGNQPTLNATNPQNATNLQNKGSIREYVPTPLLVVQPPTVPVRLCLDTVTSLGIFSTISHQ